MSNTHVDGQRLAECPSCGRSIRLKPARIEMYSAVSCGCGTDFDRDSGEVVG